MNSSEQTGSTRLRHSEITDTFVKIIHDVFVDVEVEPTVQLLEGRSFFNKSTSIEDNAHIDNKYGLWELGFSKSFLFMTIFNLLA